MMDKIFSDMFDDDDESMEDIMAQEAVREEDDYEDNEPGIQIFYFHAVFHRIYISTNRPSMPNSR